MKTKISIDKLKSSIIVCFFMVLLNFLFSMAVFLLIWYWAMPNISFLIPPLKTWLESLGIAKDGSKQIAGNGAILEEFYIYNGKGFCTLLGQ